MRFLGLTVLLLTLGLSVNAEEKAFKDFLKTFKKIYHNEKELVFRRSIFDQNYQKMLAHNERYEAGEISWFMKVHPDMDLTSQEWAEKRLGGVPPRQAHNKLVNKESEQVNLKLKELGPAPREFDWTTAGGVSSVKDQGYCGSCACFSAVATIESCFMIQHNDSAADDLSEQHLLDCGLHHHVHDDFGNWGAFGCNGAWPNVYLDFVAGQANQDESAYPYTSGDSGKVTHCRPAENGDHVGAMVTDYVNKWDASEMDMEDLVRINPTATSVLATDNWSAYGGGVLDDSLCCDAADDSHCVSRTNHSVLVVGWGVDEAGNEYWLIKNSWGDSWGEEGFMKLKKGTGHCGVGFSQQTIPTC